MDEPQDYCYVFNAHALDERPNNGLPESIEAFIADPINFIGPKVGLTKLQLKHYLACMCNYRRTIKVLPPENLSNWLAYLPGESGLDESDDPLTTCFSTYSTSIHHSTTSMIGKELPNIEHQSTFGIVRAVSSLMSMSRLSPNLPEVEMTNDGYHQLLSDSTSSRLLDHPIAFAPETAGSQKGQFVSAGMDAIPSFYGLTPFIDALKQVDEGCILPAEDFMFFARDRFLRTLEKCGAYVTQELSADGRKLLVKLRLREEYSKLLANHVEYLIQTDKDATTCEYLKNDEGFVPPYIPFDQKAEDPDHGFFAARCGRQVWSRAKEEESCIFRNVDRLRLLQYATQFHFNLEVMTKNFDDYRSYEITGNRRCDYSWNFTRKLKLEKYPAIPPLILAYYPLHKESAIKSLRTKWGNFNKISSLEQPFDEIRDYFGEATTFYFIWTSYFTKSMAIPAILGFIVFIVQITESRHHGVLTATSTQYLTAFYAVYMALWSALIPINWSSIESKWRIKWGMSSQQPLAASSKLERSEYSYDYLIVDPLNPARMNKYCASSKVATRQNISSAITVLSMAAIFISLVAISALAALMRQLPGELSWLRKNERGIVTTLQASTIVILDVVWCSVVRRLVGFENHRFENNFIRSFVGKMFLFRFANTFYALIYIAFGKNTIDPCASKEEGGCFPYFQTQLGVLYVFFLVYKLYELGFPLFEYYISTGNPNLARLHQWQGASEQYHMVPYDGRLLVEDYIEIIVQYCCVMFFSIAFPIVPLFAYINNSIEIRVDAWKLVNGYRRVFPSMNPEGLKTYNEIVSLIGLVTAPINVALCLFLIPFEAIHNMSLAEKLTFMFFAEHILIGLRLYTEFNTDKSNDSVVDSIREGMRLAAHEIVWGHSNTLKLQFDE